MKSIKLFSRISLVSLIISTLFSTSIYLLLFQDINVSKRGLVFWFFMFLVFYLVFALLERTRFNQNWKSVSKRLKILSILLTPVVGYLILNITHFDLPNAILFLPKQQITIETTQKNNPLSSGSVIEIDGIKNGENWISYKSNSLRGDFTIQDHSLILSAYPAEINYTDRIIDLLEVNFIARPDAGIVKIISNGQEKEIDLFSEIIQPKPITRYFPTPLAVTFFLTFLYSISIGILMFLFPVIIFVPKFFKPGTLKEKTGTSDVSLNSLLLSTSMCIFFFVFMEWLFYITKPSFMNYYGLPEKVIILLSCFSAIAIFSLIIVYAIFKFISLISKNGLNRKLIMALVIVPTMVLSVSFLLLIDNFTYTLFNFGIVSAEGFLRAVYGLIFLVIMAVLYSQVENFIEFISGIRHKRLLEKSVMLFIFVSFLATNFKGLYSQNSWEGGDRNKNTVAAHHPNIIYITSDGVNSRNMSLYGYERDTTPRLLELSESSLVANNAFTNSGNTAGSILSVFTGKYPSETRMLYPPDILQGENSYESLIAILRDYGYFSVQLAVTHYVDSYERNLLNGFNVVNGRSINENRICEFIPQDTCYFINKLNKRVVERLEHIFFINDMVNVFEQVSTGPHSYNDREKINELINLIDSKENPLFVHVHLMGTHGDIHGGNFNPSEQIFSKGQSQNKQGDWNLDFYDDSIYEFDSLMGSVIDELIAKNKLDDTLIIIGSDHGIRWSRIERIPLIIRFPGGEHAGLINGNVQNLDIAPTILDYLNIEIPAWMEGESLLSRDDSQIQSPIISFYGHDEMNWNQNFDYYKVFPPFYQFDEVYLIYCQNWFQLNLDTNVITSGVITDYKNPCSDESLLSNEEAFKIMKDHLHSKHFDTSSLNYKEIPR